jgi:chromosome segregation ATPase
LTSKYELEKSTFIEESKKASQENKDTKELLKKSYRELESMSSIAKQTSSVMEENKELRADMIELKKKHDLELDRVKERYNIEIDKLKESHVNLEEQHNVKIDSLKASNEKLQQSINTKDKELFKVTHTLDRFKEDLEQYQTNQKQKQIESNEKQKELENIKSKYNQLLGKIEILERLEKEHNEVDDR